MFTMPKKSNKMVAFLNYEKFVDILFNSDNLIK